MIHYDTADWVDYLRGLREGDGRQAMEEHLRGGCARCRETFGRLAALAAHVAADEAYEPPPGVVRRARALFAQLRPEHVVGLRRRLARLMYDSFAQPLPAGVRGHARSTRQALYEVDHMFVDLRLERAPGRSAVALVGQLLCAGDAGAPVSRRPVVLTSGQSVIAATSSNEHGEFHLECEPAGRMRLHIPVEDGAGRIEIALKGLMPEAGPRVGEPLAGDARHDKNSSRKRRR